MSTAINWNGTAYSVPAAGERGWSNLSNFLIALGQNAQTTNRFLNTIRTLTTSGQTLSATTDFCAAVHRSSPGATSVILPTGVNGQMFFIVDALGDAGTNNITITGTGGQTIKGAASYIINQNNGGVLVQWSTTENTWVVIITANELNDPTTTRGDIIRRGASVLERLAAVTNNRVVRGNGTDVVSGQIDATGFFTSGAAATSAAYGVSTTFVPAILSAVKTVTSANYTILDNDGYDAILVNTTSSNRTITLPTAADNIGRKLYIKKDDSGAGELRIAGEGAETIDGSNIQTIFKADGYANIVCDGTTWHIIGGIQESGSATLTGSNGTNTTVGNATAFFTRVGALVTVFGTINIDPTAAAPTASDYLIALPIPSNLGATTDLAGVANSQVTTTSQSGQISADVTGNNAQVDFVARSTTAANHYFNFMYTII